MMDIPEERGWDVRRTGRWRALTLLAATLVLAMSTWFSASAVIPQLRVQWDLSDSAAAWLTIAVQLGFVFGALISSLVNLPDIISPRHGILGGALVVGNAMPHLVNGLGGLDWRLVIYVSSTLTLAGGLLTEFAVKEGPFPFPRAIFDPRQAGRVFSNRGVRLASFGYFGHMWELFAMYAWFLVFFSEALVVRGAPVGSSAAYATFAVIAIGGLGSWVGGILGDCWGRTRTTAAMMGISG